MQIHAFIVAAKDQMYFAPRVSLQRLCARIDVGGLRVIDPDPAARIGKLLEFIALDHEVV